MKPTVVLVGGYLGAGKTTLLLKAAEILEQRGIRTGLVMNDQGTELVDTGLAAMAGREIRQVTGACFCCDLPGLVESLHSLRAAGAEVILAEPVGSCTDIARTVLHPLQQLSAEWIVAPFTVLVDPQRAAAMQCSDDLAYLFDMQIAEADLLVVSKADMGLPCPAPAAASLSARTGAGVDEWLQLVLGTSDIAPGGKSIEVDYARYGAGEASLAWLNWSATVTCPSPAQALELLGPFVEEIRCHLRRDGHDIAHLKALDSGPMDHLRVSLCGIDDEFAMEGAVIGDPRSTHCLLLNLRAECTPEAALEALASGVRVLKDVGEVVVEHQQCFQPSQPWPSVDRFASPMR